jgi:hypothetical protein
MTGKQEAVRRLVEVCPGFTEAWRVHLESWKGKPAGEYNDLGALADWVVKQIATGEMDCFPQLFREVEELLLGATEELRDLLVIGFLEDLQNVSVNNDVDPDVILSFLGRESRKGWFDLIKFWHGPDASGWVGQKREG